MPDISTARVVRAMTAVAILLLATLTASAEGPSRFAVLVEGGASWESHAPQSFLLANPAGREPQLEFDRGNAWGASLDVQLGKIFLMRASYETGPADLSITLFPPPGLPQDSRVATTRYQAVRAGVYFHGLLRRDLFDPAAEDRSMGRFGASVGRARLNDVRLGDGVLEAFDVGSVSTRDAWIFALEAEWIARLGRSRWFAGVGVSIAVGPGPKVVLDPEPGSPFVRSEFEYRANRLTARLGYRF